MISIHEHASEEQWLRTLHKLIPLGIAHWLPVIVTLHHRISEIEQVMDEEADQLLHQLEHFLDEMPHQTTQECSQQLVEFLSGLPVWRYQATSGKHRWNPLEESLQAFKERHGPVSVFESPDPMPEPTQVSDWLNRLYDGIQAQDHDVLAT